MMKKTVCIGMMVCILLSLCSCKKTPNITVNEASKKDISFISVMLGDKNIEEWNENNVIANVAWNSLKLSEDDEKKFPKLKKTFDTLNNEALKDAKSLMYELTGAAKDLEGDEYNPLYLEGQSNVYLQRADTMIVSFLEDVFVNSGGVHPDYHYITSNFNPQTGEKLVLTDVMKSLKGLPDILEGELCIKYDYLNFGENQLWTIFNEYSPEDYNWTLDYQGITFWFSPYDIAAYAAGPLSVKIYFDEEPYIFNEEYTKAPSENFCLMLPMRQKLDFDLSSNDAIILLRAAAVQAGERLYRLDVIKHLVHIHGVEQRLIKARLKHIRNDENAIRVFFELFRYFSVREAVQFGRGERRFLSLILVLAGKGYDRLIRTVPVRKALIDRVIIFDTAGNV